MVLLEKRWKDLGEGLFNWLIAFQLRSPCYFLYPVFWSISSLTSIVDMEFVDERALRGP